MSIFSLEMRNIYSLYAKSYNMAKNSFLSEAIFNCIQTEHTLKIRKLRTKFPLGAFFCGRNTKY